MLKTPEKIIRVACAVLAFLVLLEVSRLVSRSLPLRKLEVPAVPSLAMAATNSPGDTKKGTNSLSTSTNNGAKPSTNQVTSTNSAASNKFVATEKTLSATNTSARPETTSAISDSNSLASTVSTNKLSKTNQPSTNAILAAANGTNRPSSAGKAPRPGSGMPGGVMAGGSPARPELPPSIKARIDRIVQSELLGMVMHPMPMALLGIAGEEAFLRSPDGQTAAAKEGEKVGTLKLLQIGTNRVLVELDGKKQELMIFSGLGGDSLMPKEKTKPNETKKPSP